MPAGTRAILYARLCFRLSLRREQSALAILGLQDVQTRVRTYGAAPASRAFAGRFDSPGFPVLYAAEAVATCEAEVTHHLLSNYLKHCPGLRPQAFTCALLEVPMAGLFDDLRRPGLGGLTAPTSRSYPAARQYAQAASRLGLDGLIYGSPRHSAGTCIARFLPGGLRLAVQEVGTRTYHWNGKKVT